MQPENMPREIRDIWIQIWADEGYELYWKPHKSPSNQMIKMVERCRECGKLFEPYKVESFGREFDSAICRECRKKYGES